jgi:hypothetical protein
VILDLVKLPSDLRIKLFRQYLNDLRIVIWLGPAK